MAKSSKTQMQEDEMKVLVELTKNANDKIQRIAKHCGFSKQKTWRIIKQLEVNGLIWGYTAVFNEEKIGRTHFILMIKRTGKYLQEKTADIIISRELEDRVAELDIIIESSMYVHGEYDWIITFTAKDILQAKKLSESLVSLHPGIIEKITILQTLMFIKKQYILNPDRKKLKEFL
jgi:DNA-binding Lrp family transcriptional regulator